jgi:hypothetical protein
MCHLPFARAKVKVCAHDPTGTVIVIGPRWHMAMAMAMKTTDILSVTTGVGVRVLYTLWTRKSNICNYKLQARLQLTRPKLQLPVSGIVGGVGFCK